MNRTLFFICYFISIYTYSQNHQLIDTTDFEQRESLIKSYEKKYETFNKQINSSYKGKMRKEVSKFYEVSQTNVLQLIENKKLLFDHRFQNYVDSLYSILKSKNIVLTNEPINLYVTKDPSPNAISIGDGTIFLNIGLFNLLENEYQLQSVIAHEVGHLILEHSKKNIEKKANLNSTVLSRNSYTTRSINKEKYNKGTRSFELLKDMLYTDGEERRQQEIEADSIGYLIYKSTGAPNTEFIKALATLKLFDSVPAIVLDSTIYKKMFDLPEQAFNESWLKRENFENYNYALYKEKISIDSLKDHPEIDERIKFLETKFPELNQQTNIDFKADNRFDHLKQIVDQSYVENLYYINEYGLSIYLILNRLENNYDDNYLKKWLGINFEGLYDAKKKYQLNRYVDRLVPNEQSESYQKFLNFIWNLNLTEIGTIANHYKTP